MFHYESQGNFIGRKLQPHICQRQYKHFKHLIIRAIRKTGNGLNLTGKWPRLKVVKADITHMPEYENIYRCETTKCVLCLTCYILSVTLSHHLFVSVFLYIWMCHLQLSHQIILLPTQCDELISNLEHLLIMLNTCFWRIHSIKLNYLWWESSSQILQAILCFFMYYSVQYSQHKKETLTDSEHKAKPISC